MANQTVKRLDMAPGERAEEIKKRLQVKSLYVKNFRRTPLFPNYECIPITQFKAGTTICTQHAHLYKESFEASDGESMVIRRAKALAHILDNMTIYILPYELIVGNFASKPSALSLMPELGQQWFDEAMDKECAYLIGNEKVRKECKELIRFWDGRSVTDNTHDAMPEDIKDYVSWNGVSNSFCGAWRSSETCNFEKQLKLGLNGVIKDVEERLVRLDSEFDTMDDHRDYVSKKHNLKAMLIALKAGVRFGKRYADKARELAKKETDDTRRRELNRIAEVCDWVPANPARTLHEAVQSCFFVNLITKMMLGYGQGGGNRLDVLFNPYYQKDKEEGRITREEAEELMECWLLKFLERGKMVHPNLVAASTGNSDWVNFMIGGLSLDGQEDVTNEFSFIVLDALAATRVTEPTISIRYNSKTPDELLSRAIDILSTGLGHPNFFNDGVLVKHLMNYGVPEQLALDYGSRGCVALAIPGENFAPFTPQVGNFSLIKCLELALYQGRDKPLYTGKQLGVKTPDPRTFTSIDELIEAYLTQVRFFMDKVSKIQRVSSAVAAEFAQRPFASAFVRGCIEEGKDANELGNNYFSTILPIGFTNVADSLAAIKKFVFEDKVITMGELIQACWTNFEGKEDLRQRLINEAPKFGNDDDYVDSIARDVHIRTHEEMAKFKDFSGLPIISNGSIAGGYLNLSKTCGATPDGRMDSEGCADAVVSPMAGRDKKGPTAVLKSVSKIPVLWSHLLNQKFLPQFLKGENKKKFIQYIRSWGDLGISHIQFNAMDKETLLDAQAHPELYQDLVVRVAGYSAYFVDLSSEIQHEIIKRTEQVFV